MVLVCSCILCMHDPILYYFFHRISKSIYLLNVVFSLLHSFGAFPFIYIYLNNSSAKGEKSPHLTHIVYQSTTTPVLHRVNVQSLCCWQVTPWQHSLCDTHLSSRGSLAGVCKAYVLFHAAHVGSVITFGVRIEKRQRIKAQINYTGI